MQHHTDVTISSGEFLDSWEEAMQKREENVCHVLDVLKKDEIYVEQGKI